MTTVDVALVLSGRLGDQRQGQKDGKKKSHEGLRTSPEAILWIVTTIVGAVVLARGLGGELNIV